jgi:hypothetical protein
LKVQRFLRIKSSLANSKRLHRQPADQTSRIFENPLEIHAGEMTWRANFTLPNNFPTGTAQTFLWLYDTCSTYTAANPKFSIRLDGVTWNTTYGANQLTSALNNIQIQ